MRDDERLPPLADEVVETRSVMFRTPGSLALAAVLYGLTSSPGIAIGLGLADLVLRPLVILPSKLGMAGLWRRVRARSIAAGEHAQGAGI